MKLILVRHGATEWSITGQHTGSTDLPLTAAGVRQAQMARPLLSRLLGAEQEQAIVYSSPMERARVTAEIVTGISASKLILSPELSEYNYGDYEGLTPAQVRDLCPGWDIWRDGCPRGETVDDVGARANTFISQAAAHSSPVIAFAHGHILRIIAACALGLDAQLGQVFTLDTGTVSIIQDVRGKRVVKMWNLDPAIVR